MNALNIRAEDHDYQKERGAANAQALGVRCPKYLEDARKLDVLNPGNKQGAFAVQVLPTQLIPDEKEGKVLRVRMIQKEGVKFFDPAYLFDEGSTINWIPCGRKLTCSFPGIKFFYGPDTYYGEEVHLSLHSPIPL